MRVFCCVVVVVVCACGSFVQPARKPEPIALVAAAAGPPADVETTVSAVVKTDESWDAHVLVDGHEQAAMTGDRGHVQTRLAFGTRHVRVDVELFRMVTTMVPVTVMVPVTTTVPCGTSTCTQTHQQTQTQLQAHTERVTKSRFACDVDVSVVFDQPRSLLLSSEDELGCTLAEVEGDPFLAPAEPSR